MQPRAAIPRAESLRRSLELVSLSSRERTFAPALAHSTTTRLVRLSGNNHIDAPHPCLSNQHGSTSSKARLSKEPAANLQCRNHCKTMVEHFILYTNPHPTEHSQKSNLLVLLESSHSGLAKVHVYKG